MRTERRSNKRTALWLGLLLLAAGCTGAPAEPAASLPPLASTTSASTTPVSLTPLTLIVHRSRPARSIELGTARALLAGTVTDASSVGLAGTGPPRLLAGTSIGASLTLARRAPDTDVVAAVSRDPRLIGAVPGAAVTPLVRALSVGGIDPLRSPSRYPLTIPGEPSGRVSTLAIAGDVMLGRRVGASMQQADDFAAPLRPMAARLAAADVTIANFEATLSREGSPTQGGDSFGADPRVRQGLQLAGIDVLSLANNHVGDWGSRALVQTIAEVEGMGITPVGAGENLEQARSPAIIDAGGVRVGVLATDSIGESPAAGRTTPGTNRLDMPPRTGPLDEAALARVVSDIRALRRTVDLVVVIPHWGTQYTHRPEASQRRVGAAMLRAGADLVVGGHPHWVQGVELVEGVEGLLVHSLGNFVFDMDFQQRTQEGVLLEAVAWNGKLKAVEFVPYVIGSDFAPRVVRGDRAAAVLAPFRASSDAPFNGG